MFPFDLARDPVETALPWLLILGGIVALAIVAIAIVVWLSRRNRQQQPGPEGQGVRQHADRQGPGGGRP